MWLDERAEFADALAVTLGSGTNLIGDVMDLTSNRDIGVSKHMYLIVQVTTAFAGSGTFSFVLASDSVAAIATDGSETRHFQTDVFTDAQLPVGMTMSIPLPAGDTARGEDVAGYERFLGVLGIGTGTRTAGAVNAFLSPEPLGWIAYPDAQN